MKKIAIIGASYLQLPLIRKAKEMGIETHVFAWMANDVGEQEADFFYPISIIEKDEILKKCKEIHIDGICSIASDLANITVCYVANKMGLITNSLDCCEKSTNKHLMRKCFEENGNPSPKSILYDESININQLDIKFPVIVKPTDRSGSRGITKCNNTHEIEKAIKCAIDNGFEKKALIEEYAEGEEYSVETISWQGKHQVLQITLKYTTGSPNYIETGHLEPAPITPDLRKRIEKIIIKALNSLDVEYGASHSEIKIDKNENIKIIEIGSRMGGDLIGSNLVKMSTGYDFVENVIKIALGEKPSLYTIKKENIAGVKFIFDKADFEKYKRIEEKAPEVILEKDIEDNINGKVTDSSSRHGYYLLAFDNYEQAFKYMPKLD